MSPRPTFIIGAGCTSFEKPRGVKDYDVMAVEAGTKALIDAGINYVCTSPTQDAGHVRR